MINEKLDLSNKRMGEFLIGDLFDIIHTNKKDIIDVKKLSEVKQKPLNYVDAISATTTNNQRAFYVKVKNNNAILNHKISLTANGDGKIFYQSLPFVVLQDAYALDLIDDNYKNNENVLLFLMSVQSINMKKYNYSQKSGWARVKKDTVTLPIKEDGTPDYEWMAQYISQIKKEKEKEINIYLEENHLNNSILTEQEKLFLDKWRSESVKMGEFLVGDLFQNISGSKSNVEKIIKVSECKQKPDGYFNAISATTQNNQIAFYIKPKNVENVLKNKLSISANGSGTGAIFYQKHNFLIAQDAYVIDLKNTNYNSNENVLLFIAGEQKKNTDKYNYSLKAGWNRVKKDVLTLPIKEDGTPDYEAMEQYILIMKKMAVKKVNQKYNDTISKTEEVVNNH